jgi:hypothetical protein
MQAATLTVETPELHPECCRKKVKVVGKFVEYPSVGYQNSKADNTQMIIVKRYT